LKSTGDIQRFDDLGERPLRIALFSDSALPILNGVSVSIDSLIRELRNLGHSVHVFTAAHFRFRDPDPNTVRFPAIQTPWTKDYPLAIPPFYPMLRAFRQQDFDVIHTHTPFTIGFVGLRWGQSHGIPVVSTYHTLYDKYAHYIPFFPKRYVRYKIAKHTNFYYNQVDQIITPSESSLKWLRRHSVQPPIHVVPTGLPNPLPLQRGPIRQKLGIPADARMLLYVGRIAKEKNMSVLLEAAALVMRDPRVWLYLVGDGPFRASCSQLARSLGIGDRVRFVGFVDREEVDAYYAAADLFVFASMTETQGLVVTEAMAYGLPAVVVTGGGASENVRDGENGRLVRNDASQLADAALEMLEDDQSFARMCQEAARTASRFSCETMAQRVVEVYRGVLSGAGERQHFALR